MGNWLCNAHPYTQAVAAGVAGCVDNTGHPILAQDYRNQDMVDTDSDPNAGDLAVQQVRVVPRMVEVAVPADPAHCSVVVPVRTGDVLDRGPAPRSTAGMLDSTGVQTLGRSGPDTRACSTSPVVAHEVEVAVDRTEMVRSTLGTNTPVDSASALGGGKDCWVDHHHRWLLRSGMCRRVGSDDPGRLHHLSAGRRCPYCRPWKTRAVAADSEEAVRHPDHSLDRAGTWAGQVDEAISADQPVDSNL